MFEIRLRLELSGSYEFTIVMFSVVLFWLVLSQCKKEKT